ncbi:MAG: hypothetical protein WDN46_14290 [Methylocella sp.]
MAIQTDLTGLGVPPAVAERIGYNIAPLNGIGTTQAGAAKIGSSITLANAQTGATAYTLPTGPIAMGKEHYVFNVGAVAALVFPPLGGATLNGSTTGDISIAAGKGAIFMLVAGSGGAAPQWVCVAGA